MPLSLRFHLKAPNGEIIAASQGYETKASAEKGIEAIKTDARKARSKTTPASACQQHHSCGVGVGAWSRGGLALVRMNDREGRRVAAVQ